MSIAVGVALPDPTIVSWILRKVARLMLHTSDRYAGSRPRTMSEHGRNLRPTSGRQTRVVPSKPVVATRSRLALYPGTAPWCPSSVCVWRATSRSPNPETCSSNSYHEQGRREAVANSGAMARRMDAVTWLAAYCLLSNTDNTHTSSGRRQKSQHKGSPLAHGVGDVYRSKAAEGRDA